VRRVASDNLTTGSLATRRGGKENETKFLKCNTNMDTENRQSENLSSSGAQAPELAVDSFAVRSAAVAGPSAGSSSPGEFPVVSPDLWEVTATGGDDNEWSFSREGLRAFRRVNLGELLALLGAEQQSDEASGNLTDEFHAKTGVLKGAQRLRLGVWDNMRRRWEAVVGNECVITLRLTLDYEHEEGTFGVSVPGVGWLYNLELEGAYARKEGGGENE